MTYQTPELTLLGRAQGLVLGDSFIADPDNLEQTGNDPNLPGTVPQEEW